jgi:hypothetical protein
MRQLVIGDITAAEMAAEIGGRCSASSGAYFSPDSEYRYALWRIWESQGHSSNVMFVGLNPSTADEIENDATIRKCIGFAKRWGYGGIYMLNLYAFVSTDPRVMVHSPEPIGPGNDESFGYYRSHVGLIVAAWGNIEVRYRPRIGWQSRIKAVLELISRPVYCLGKTQDGSPRHPSRIGYDTPRELFWEPTLTGKQP